MSEKPTNEANELVSFLQQAFQEDNGNPSSMRVLSFLALGAAISFGAIALFNPVTEVVAVNLTVAFLAAAFGPKAVQKFAEKAAEKPAEQANPYPGAPEKAAAEQAPH